MFVESVCVLTQTHIRDYCHSCISSYRATLSQRYEESGLDEQHSSSDSHVLRHPNLFKAIKVKLKTLKVIKKNIQKGKPTL